MDKYIDECCESLINKGHSFTAVLHFFSDIQNYGVKFVGLPVIKDGELHIAMDDVF
jgi:hypothetical protein